ncbi:MAG: hypothetical protein OQK09_00610 [Colwellia sp.]|nr:hypothetical protein [Colwellia sp.]MCW8866531.1 hypothetical protein [Colwellia sp.]MCW9079989.1 hypothetical protein [Colwellia sp.]
MNRCGKCQQFTRTSDNVKDTCGAWDQPTTATRQACEFFLPKKSQRDSKKS